MNQEIAAGLKLPRLDKGWVWLVGAGPGDPGLITVLGLQALIDADYVLYDALVDESLLALSKAEKIYAGKRAGVRSCKQDEISGLLVELAKGGSRVLRYLLPAYPAFSIFAVLGLQKVVPARYLRDGLSWAAPIALLVAAGIALFPPTTLHAEETKSIAAAVKPVTSEKDRIAFYDDGQARFDETGQIQWYGDRIMWILLDQKAFEHALAEPISKVWIVDAATFERYFVVLPGATVIARSGHLVCVRLT